MQKLSSTIANILPPCKDKELMQHGDVSDAEIKPPDMVLVYANYIQ